MVCMIIYISRKIIRCNHWSIAGYGLLARYVKLRFAHAPGMPGTCSPPPWFSDPDIHYGTCVTHVPWCMPGSLTIGFLWNRWRGKRSRHSPRMRDPQFYESGKRPMSTNTTSRYLAVWNDGVIKWKHFLCYWPFVRGIHRSRITGCTCQ